MKISETVVVRGGGDLATGIIWRLHRVGYRVVCLEAPLPTVIRRPVSAAEAVFAGQTCVEGLRFQLLPTGTFPATERTVPVWIDPQGESIAELAPDVVVDAIMAKRKTGTHRAMAPKVVAIGPGFVAGEDVHCVVETLRGHSLGRVLYRGPAASNTGVPGVIGGESARRIVRAPHEGRLGAVRTIGDVVAAGDLLGHVGETPVTAAIGGLLRGLIHPSVPLKAKMKIGDIDPRNEEGSWLTISDKAMAVAGGVLEAILADLPEEGFFARPLNLRPPENWGRVVWN